MGKFNSKVNQRFGTITVLKRVGDEIVWNELYNRNQIYVRYLCKCDCGKELIRNSSYLNKNSYCGNRNCSKQYEDQTGKVFGELTVIRVSQRDKNGNIKWLCRCSCGNELEAFAANLKRTTKSCGCIYTDLRLIAKKAANSLPPGEANFRNILSRYKYRAKNSELKWELTSDQFRLLTSQNCFYCDKKPSTITKTSKRGFTPYIYNGVDRLNSDIGYIKENCVTCCSDCNYAKQDSTYSEFLDHIKRIYFTMVEKGLI